MPQSNAFKFANNILTNGGYDAADLVGAAGGANTPAFWAYQSTTHSVSNTNHTKILFQTEVLDSDNNFASSRFTPTTAGYYLLTIGLRCDSGACEHFLQIYKNGSNYISLRDDEFTSYQLNGSAIVDANGSTDYFEVYFWQNSGTTRTTNAGKTHTYFSGFKLIGV